MLPPHRTVSPTPWYARPWRAARWAARSAALPALPALPALLAGAALGRGPAQPAPPAAQPMPAAGYWKSQDGTAVFEVAPCADGGARPSPCGRLAWAKEGTARADAKNPDAALRARPLCNAVVVGGFTAESPTNWKDGYVYDWNSGKRYKTGLVFTSDSTAELRVRYGVMRFTDRWRRVAAPPARCQA